jgi:hypothetical protein
MDQNVKLTVYETRNRNLTTGRKNPCGGGGGVGHVPVRVVHHLLLDDDVGTKHDPPHRSEIANGGVVEVDDEVDHHLVKVPCRVIPAAVAVMVIMTAAVGAVAVPVAVPVPVEVSVEVHLPVENILGNGATVAVAVAVEKKKVGNTNIIPRVVAAAAREKVPNEESTSIKIPNENEDDGRRRNGGNGNHRREIQVMTMTVVTMMCPYDEVSYRARKSKCTLTKLVMI